MGNYIHTPSVMYKNKLFDKFPTYFAESPVGDYFLHMLNAKYGKIKKLEGCMAVYRVHDISHWSSMLQEKKDKLWLTMLKNMRMNFTPYIQEIIDKQIVDMETSLYQKYCNICNQPVESFLKLPDYYNQKHKEYNYPYTFDDAETLNYLEYSCPHCGSSDRERIYALYFDSVFKNIDKNKKYSFLHFAPPKALEYYLRKLNFLDYKSADLMMKDVDYQDVDICDMHSVFKDNSFDFFICSHVLEHVLKPDNALTELYRILKTEGIGIIMVPIIKSLDHTLEDPAHVTEAERWEHYGQGDHLRVFAKKDFMDRIVKAGFKLTTINFSDLPIRTEEFHRLGISPNSILYIVNKPRKNHR